MIIIIASIFGILYLILFYLIQIQVSKIEKIEKNIDDIKKLFEINNDSIGTCIKHITNQRYDITELKSKIIADKD
jgi:hypothetical protein